MFSAAVLDKDLDSRPFQGKKGLSEYIPSLLTLFMGDAVPTSSDLTSVQEVREVAT